MKIEFKTSFVRDIKKMDNSTKSQIEELILNVEKAENLLEINNIKKLSGYKTFFRIKIGEFRVGMCFENDTVFFVRCLNRKDIYKFFP